LLSFNSIQVNSLPVSLPVAQFMPNIAKWLSLDENSENIFSDLAAISVIGCLCASRFRLSTETRTACDQYVDCKLATGNHGDIEICG